MKALGYALCIFAFLAMNAQAEDIIVGRWAYFMKIYKGQEMPEPPEATLRLRFEFLADGQSHLYWWNEGQGNHCERRGHYRVTGNILEDHVEWVDPNNSFSCSDDPDMENGKVTKTPFAFRNGNLVIRLQLGEEELFYVWKKIP